MGDDGGSQSQTAHGCAVKLYDPDGAPVFSKSGWAKKIPSFR
jgi:hypothetical protein